VVKESCVASHCSVIDRTTHPSNPDHDVKDAGGDWATQIAKAIRIVMACPGPGLNGRHAG